MQTISIIAAHTQSRVIGKDGKIPWFNVEEIRKPDMKRFKDLTLNRTVIMGRKTYESLPEKFRPLPDRENIVLSRSEFFQPEQGVIVAKSLDEALRFASAIDLKEVFIIGGQQVFQQAMKKYASKMYLTELKSEYEGDAFFPEFNREEWKETSRVYHDFFDFVEYKRNYWHA